MLRYHRHVAALAGVLVATAVSFGARRADAQGVYPSCWASNEVPYKNGSNVVVTTTWQCSAGVQQQFEVYTSLTSPDGTRYTNYGRCYNATYCTVTVSAPFRAGTWTAKGEYAYVVFYDNSSSYFFGGSASIYYY